MILPDEHPLDIIAEGASRGLRENEELANAYQAILDIVANPEQQSFKAPIIAIVGPSGSGKDYLLDRIIDLCPTKLHRIRQDTTRDQRAGEPPKRYNFISEYEYMHRRVFEHYAETQYFNGWYYGTPYSEIEVEKTAIGCFSPRGLLDLCKNPRLQNRTIVAIYIDNVSWLTRFERSICREDKITAEMIRRMNSDRHDFHNFEYRMHALQRVCPTFFFHTLTELTILNENTNADNVMTFLRTNCYI